ncbi:MAG: Rrf2 family transcriptional regulator, partial [Halioglobus sp.]|nr:Rrf2 family transcriptional regulator [Halioglobus sp.]
GHDIFVAQIIDAVNDTVDATGCGGTADCQQGEVCLTHHLWCDLSDQIHDFLSEISLSDLVERREVQSIAARQDARSFRSNTLLLTEI